MADLKSLKGVAERDQRMIDDAQTLLGPEPASMGFVKNLFWGNVRDELVFPYPEPDAEEEDQCNRLLETLDHYLEHEHPSFAIDRFQEIPRWAIDRLFEIGVMGMTIPREFGGGGFGIRSYNRVLERIGRSCGSTAVMVSAHQSIGCKAIVLFGTGEQKRRWLRPLATDTLSAFCLSEPGVGCDAGGQQTHCRLSDDGTHYLLNGEKKWATSGALSGLFTVMARQSLTDPATGKTTDKITALVCTPDMPGVEIYQKNRSKCGIRGTWQARIRFHDVRVPRSHLLHHEGKGLHVALTCLNFGRCTLSAGMLGGARRAFDQSVKWAQTRFQFQRPLADFELVAAKIARMSAFTYAMDALLYLTCAMLDRHDEDIMLETAVCKLFCSEMGWRCVNDAMQIMGGEGYMTENEIERIFRDSRINLIVEGANEVMQSFIFAYGGKQLAEQMLGVKQAVGWDHAESPTHNLARILRGLGRPEVLKAAAPLGAELLLGVRPGGSHLEDVDDSLQPFADRLCKMTREHSHQFKLAARQFGEQIVSRQLVQARLADSAMWLVAWAATLSRLNRDISTGGNGTEFDRNKSAAIYFMNMAETEIRRCFHELARNDDEPLRAAADSALRHGKTLPNDLFSIPESSPVAAGTGRRIDQGDIQQFPGESAMAQTGNCKCNVLETSVRLQSTPPDLLVPSPGTPGEG
jgi:alkylation response protein AidB-like acyl-CoA dehydrogenase